MEILLFILIGLLVASIIVQFLLRYKPLPQTDLNSRIDQFAASLHRIETNLKDDFRINRDESTRLAKENRDELHT